MNVLKDKRVLEIIGYLDEAGVFDDGEITLLKNYLSGTVDRKALERLNIRDMSRVSRGYSHEVSHLLRDLEEKGKNVPAGKIGDFLFAAGGISAKDFFKYVVLKPSECRILEGEPVKRAALWAACS